MQSTNAHDSISDDVIEVLQSFFLELDPIFSGFIGSMDVLDLCKKLKVNEERLMLILLAYPQIGKVINTEEFNPTAICKGRTGNLYYGSEINTSVIQIPGVQSSCINAIQHGEEEIKLVASSKELTKNDQLFLAELNGGLGLEVMYLTGERKNIKEYFDANVNFENPFREPDHQLKLSYPTEDDLVNRALGEANRSYSSRSKSYSGVSILMKNGEIHGGSFLETESLSHTPLGTSLINVISCGGKLADIQRICMVEGLGTKVSQVNIVRNEVRKLLPEIRFEFYNAAHDVFLVKSSRDKKRVYIRNNSGTNT